MPWAFLPTRSAMSTSRYSAMMPTIMIAAPIGVRVGHMLSETWLRRIYTVLLFVIAVDLIRKLTI